jgi:outer membrane protein OmpA-like peptidoglycan-associated protein
MKKERLLVVLCALCMVAASVGEAAAKERRRSKIRPDIVFVGDPVLISRDLLQSEARRISELSEYLDKYGWPDFAEIQEVVPEKPWAAYEVHLFYVRRMRHLVFSRVNVAPSVTDFGVRKYDGRITPEDLARLLGIRPAPVPTPVVVAAAPPPPPPPVTRKRIVLRGVYFDFDRAEIRADARPVLDEAIRVLKEEGGVNVVAEGHTDNVGGDEYNQGLSLRRAAAVKDYLVAGTIPDQRVQVTGFGETLPVASNDTEDGRAQNRRVELRVVEQ